MDDGAGKRVEHHAGNGRRVGEGRPGMTEFAGAKPQGVRRAFQPNQRRRSAFDPGQCHRIGFVF